MGSFSDTVALSAYEMNLSNHLRAPSPAKLNYIVLNMFKVSAIFSVSRSSLINAAPSSSDEPKLLPSLRQTQIHRYISALKDINIAAVWHTSTFKALEG